MGTQEFNLLVWTLLSVVFMALIVCILLVWYFSNRAKHKERMVMIEKGITPPSDTTNRSGFAWQKIGIVVIGLSIGLMLISFLAVMGLLRDNSTSALPLAILGICGGVSMIVANRMSSNKRNP
ncbi:MAG: DUF6249 domain-containing protein [Bacteroidota bacterium]